MEYMSYPLMFRLRQRLPGPRIEDVPAAVEAELTRLKLGSMIKPGDTVAVTCGKRAIANYAAILKAVVDHFKQLHATPFLLPAMGSQPGETAEDQIQILRTLGIQKETVGAEIRPWLGTEPIGQLREGAPVHCARQVLTADHIVVVNRVNLHRVFHGDVQSGLLEMIALGLGNLDLAQLHRMMNGDLPFGDIASEVHELIRKKVNLLAGLMIIQNGYQSTARILAASPDEFPAKEKAMLHYARGLFPRLPFKFIDILLVDEIGPVFDYLGVDLNVIGRKYHAHAAREGEFPQIRAIAYRDLNVNCHGNATGVGHAEFVRSRLLRKADAVATRLNSLAIGMPTLASTPIAFETDKAILDAALALIRLNLPEKARIVWIRNTSSVVQFECSKPYLEEVEHWKDLSVLSGLNPLEFDAQDNLRDFVIEDPSTPHVLG